jgi:bifunctional UDP-N-acetylglucosamine pyrophosphorylase/glucosamine-1-phosphate N-acetyltransferase
VSGINTKAQLAATEATMQQRLRQAALEGGVTLVAPETVHLAADTKLGRDVTIEPYVVFGPGVTVEAGATIRSFSHLAAPMSARTPSSVPMRGFGPAPGSKRASTSAILSR